MGSTEQTTVLFEMEGFRILKHSKNEKSHNIHLSIVGSCSSTGFALHVKDIENSIMNLDEIDIVLDTAELEYVHSRFVSLLALWAQSGKRITLKNPRPNLIDLLAIIGLENWFEVEKD